MAENRLFHNEDTEGGNVYALLADDTVIHISNARSGKQGYYCGGCKREMQAVRHTVSRVSDYFRHDAKDVAKNGRCAFPDFEYQVKVAIRSLLRDRKIKLPSVYKHPPIGVEGKAYLLQDADHFEAWAAKPLVVFYEDEDGRVAFIEKPFVPQESEMLAEPTVTFFSEDGTPKLLLFLKGKAKPDPELRVRLRTIGIDAVHVSIPRDTPEAIERIFQLATYTKWIYSSREDHAEYDLQLSRSAGAALPDFDPDQARFFEENYFCRAAGIRNLIRSIERCLESESYTSVANEIRRRIESAGRLPGGGRRKVESDYRTEGERIDREIRDVENRRVELRRKEDAESNKSDPNESEFGFERISREAAFAENRRGAEKRGAVAREATEGIRQKVGRIEGNIQSARDEESSLSGKFESAEEKERIDFESTQEDIGREILDLEERISGIGGEFEAKGRAIEERYHERQREVTDQISRRDLNGDAEIARAIQGILQRLEFFHDWREIADDEDRIRKATKEFEGKTYKSWYQV
jgi:hypothetical protein